jgi:hypothetical protein
MLTYELPLAEIVLDFFDKLKSVSRGYASMDYEFKEYRAADVVKVDIMINGDRVDPLAMIVHRSQSQYRGRAVVAKMRTLIPRQMYDVAIQASIGANIIAREDVKALRKNVLAKCYGGDITRKKQAARKAEGRQEAHEADRLRRGAAGGLPGHPAGRRLKPRLSLQNTKTPPMSALTAVLYGALLIVYGRLVAGLLDGNFSLLLFVLTVVTLLYWLAERFRFKPARERPPMNAGAAGRQRRAELAKMGIDKVDGDVAAAREKLLMQPWWLDWTAGPVPGDPDRVPAALVPVRAVQDPVGLDGAHAAGGRPDPGEQVPLRRAAAGDQQEDHRQQPPSAAT